MKKINRLPLAPELTDYLNTISTEVSQKITNNTLDIAKTWSSKSRSQEFSTIKKQLYSMAYGHRLCMYCESSHGTDIEHFFPKKQYPTKAFEWDNYLIACSYCNSNLKRERFPLDPNNNPLLIDPSKDDPSTHLKLSLNTGLFFGITERGLSSIEVFDLNDTRFSESGRDLTNQRRERVVTLKALFEKYDRLMSSHQFPQAAEHKRTIQQSAQPFVLYWMVRVYQDLPETKSRAILNDNMYDIFRKYSVDSWI